MVLELVCFSFGELQLIRMAITQNSAVNFMENFIVILVGFELKIFLLSTKQLKLLIIIEIALIN